MKCKINYISLLRLIVVFIAAVSAVFVSGCSSEQNKPPETETPEAYSVEFETISEKITDGGETVVYTISSSYPIIKSPEDKPALKNLNENFKADAENFIAEVKSGGAIANAQANAKAAAEYGKKFYPHSSSVTYTLKYNSGGIISFLKTREDYTGKTARSYFSEGITYNVKTEKKYELSEVFEAKSLGLVKILQNGFKTELSGNKEIFEGKTDFTEEEISGNIDKLKWYISPEGIVFFFNPGTILPEVNETLEFTYVYAGNKSMFNIPIAAE